MCLVCFVFFYVTGNFVLFISLFIPKFVFTFRVLILRFSVILNRLSPHCFRVIAFLRDQTFNFLSLDR